MSLTAGGRYDVVVIGAGFGGLGAALALAEGGARVLVCEALAYPGGCASTFRRDGFCFEAGATLFAGLAPEQLFGRWIERHGLDVEVEPIDPLVELRAPALTLRIRRERAALIDQLCALPGAPQGALRRFFAAQQRVAEPLWQLLDDPGLLPPLGGRALLAHARRLPAYLPLLRLVGRPLERVLADHGLAGFRPLRAYLDALCQITVQCSAAEAEAPFALGAMDYYYRGTGHVCGGIGALAEGLVEAIRGLGGEVTLANRVRRLARRDGGWTVEARHGTYVAEVVAANLLPQSLAALLGDEPAGELTRLAARVEDGWGACMLYLVAETPAGAPPGAHHLELIQDTEQPFVEGNHLFASISGAGESRAALQGLRTITVSTHVPLARLRALPAAEQGAYVSAIQQRMRAGLHDLAPEWSTGIVHALTASPRTFERFTGRFAGYVGGVPRRAGLANYRGMAPRLVAPGLTLVGDTAFPGQSILASAVGGVKAAERIAAFSRGGCTAERRCRAPAATSRAAPPTFRRPPR